VTISRQLRAAAASNRPRVPSSAALRERGYALARPGQGTWWNDLTNERTPELRWPLSIQVFDDMVRQDAQVGSVLNAIVTPILRTGWRIDGSGCRPEVVAHVAGDFGLPIVGQKSDVPAARRRGRFSWSEHLAVAVPDHLQFGHAVFEQLYFPIVPTDEGGDGLFHLRKLGYRPARTIRRWNVAADGGLISVQQYAPQMAGMQLVGFRSIGDEPEPLPINRLTVYVNRGKGGNWIGESVLRAAYKNWMLKDRNLRVGMQSVERNGLGIPVHTAQNAEQDATDAGLEIVQDLRAGDNAGASLPNGAKLELLGLSGTLPDPLRWVQYHDEQIARAVLAHFLNLGSQTGSWALGTTFADFFTMSIQAVAENIRSTATKHIIEDLVDINYGPDEPAPRLVFDEIGSRQEAILAAISQLITSKALTPDPELEKWIRTTAGLPPMEGDDGAGNPTAAATARAAAELVQKIYLGVGPVVSQKEARNIIRQAGVTLDDDQAAELAAALAAKSAAAVP